MQRLETHAPEGFDTEMLKNFITMSYYLSLPDMVGGVVEPKLKFVRSNGKEVTFKDVPLQKVISDVQNAIKNMKDGQRTDVYHKVLSGMPGHQETPEWDVPPAHPNGPNGEPKTPYSVPRDGRSNQELLDALSSAAKLSADTKQVVAIQIIWWDALVGGGDASCTNHGFRYITGGRLGRDHTIDDVPVNYFRDRLMDYISDQLPKSKQKAARKALCPDLTDDEIDEYSRLVAEERAELERSPSPTTRRDKAAKRLMAANTKFRTYEQAMEDVMMHEALDSIDGAVDLKKPNPETAHLLKTIRRKYVETIKSSVVVPESPVTRYEAAIVPQAEIDRDCDQVRAMIKAFIWPRGSWHLSDFRTALGVTSVTRVKLTDFLMAKGTDTAQLRSAAFQRSWEFFNRREQLGLSVEDSLWHEAIAKLHGIAEKEAKKQQKKKKQLQEKKKPQEENQEQDVKSKKRPSDGPEGGRVLRKRPLREIVNRV